MTSPLVKRLVLVAVLGTSLSMLLMVAGVVYLAEQIEQRAAHSRA